MTAPKKHTQKIKEKAVLLLSGGLDSATLLAMMKKQGFDIIALSFAYGQNHHHELECAKILAQKYEVREHFIFPLPLNLIGGSALTDKNIPIPQGRAQKEREGDIPVTYVPARNMIFLSFALALAEKNNCRAIFIAANHVDYSGYPDCRPEFFKQLQKAMTLGTKQGITHSCAIRIETPLLFMSKADIIRKGLELEVDYSLTLSCYNPSAQGVACGICESCLLRQEAFAACAVADPAL